MSVCSPCTTVLSVPYCATTVWVGDWSTSGVTLYVYTMNTATGKIAKEQVTSGSGGKVVIDFPNRMENASYQVWMNTTANQAFENETFKLPSTATDATCLLVSFSRMTEDGDSVVIAEHKVSV